MLLIDAHVHIYDCFDLEIFFDSAYANFKSAAKRSGNENDFTGVLLLTETSKDNWFKRLSECADGKHLPERKETGNWIIQHTEEIDSLLAESGNSKKVLLIAGRQIVTKEGLEVLACATVENFEDGMPIESLIKKIIEKNAFPIIPWGVGKWFGKKGRIVRDIINKSNNNTLIYLGDNGNRPDFWPQPKLLKKACKKGIQILPGSDPLPFASESGRAGSFGCLMQIHIDPPMATTFIKKIITGDLKGTFRVYGRLEKCHRFLLNQMRAQINKRFTQTSPNQSRQPS
jgi:hypothetical protein